MRVSDVGKQLHSDRASPVGTARDVVLSLAVMTKMILKDEKTPTHGPTQ